MCTYINKENITRIPLNARFKLMLSLVHLLQPLTWDGLVFLEAGKLWRVRNKVSNDSGSPTYMRGNGDAFAAVLFLEGKGRLESVVGDGIGVPSRHGL